MFSLLLSLGVSPTGIVALAIKKIWNRETRVLEVIQGGIVQPFGWQYLGLARRLAITPLTERCMFAMAQAFSTNTIPVINGTEASGKQAIFQELAREVGVESLVCDCATSVGEPDVLGALQAAVGGGLWLMYTHVNSLRNKEHQHLLTALLSHLTLVQYAQHTGLGKVTLGSAGLVLRPMHITLHTFTEDEGPNSSTFGPSYTTLCLPKDRAGGGRGPRGTSSDSRESHRESPPVLFRPIALWSPNQGAVLRTLLVCAASHLTSPEVSLVVARLLAFSQHVAAIASVGLPVVTNAVMFVIRSSGNRFLGVHYTGVLTGVLDGVLQRLRSSVESVRAAVALADVENLANLYAGSGGAALPEVIRALGAPVDEASSELHKTTAAPAVDSDSKLILS